MSSAPFASPAEMEKQIAFARHNFDNLQNLIRFVDTKAAALVTIVIFLGATGIQIAKEAVLSLNFSSVRESIASTVFLIACLAFILSIVWILIWVHKVLAPRGARHYATIELGRDLMWQNHVINHGTNSTYFDAVRDASPGILLKNVTDQIFELAHISKEKMDCFNRARNGFGVTFCAWLLIIVFGVLTVRWK